MKPAIAFATLALIFTNFAPAQADEAALYLTECQRLSETKDEDGLRRLVETFILIREVPRQTEIQGCLSTAFGVPWRYSEAEQMFRPAATFAAADAERQIAEAEELQASRRYDAMKATTDACAILYRRDDVEALTNPVCSPIFLASGLPD